MILKEKGYVESRGVKIHYLSPHNHKDKQTTLLFVPGIMMPAWIWEKQLDYFSCSYKVVAVDLRSHGHSEQCSEGHDAFTLAQDLKAVIDQLNLQRLILIGWSIATPIILNYAVYFAQQELKGLVMIDGIVGVDASWPFYQAMVDQWTHFQANRLTKTEEFIRLIFKQPHSDVYFEKLKHAALQTPTNTVMTLIYNYILQDFRPLLPQVKIPTLIATIEGPRLDYMKQMQKLIPSAHLEVFESAGHALFVDQPDRFNAVLEGFLKKLKKCEI